MGRSVLSFPGCSTEPMDETEMGGYSPATMHDKIKRKPRCGRNYKTTYLRAITSSMVRN